MITKKRLKTVSKDRTKYRDVGILMWLKVNHNFNLKLFTRGILICMLHENANTNTR